MTGTKNLLCGCPAETLHCSLCNRCVTDSCAEKCKHTNNDRRKFYKKFLFEQVAEVVKQGDKLTNVTIDITGKEK